MKFPEEVTVCTGLTSWPDRGSEWAPRFEMTMAKNDHLITIEYESQDALWCVRHEWKGETSFIDLFRSAETAYMCARARLDRYNSVSDI